jgi:2,4-dienoyl-CoA reductase-like NADH-dependent reductase (Old Yellow Enzyme family)
MSALFDPLTIGNVEFPNRIWVSPMCQYMAEDGFVGQWHDVHLGSFATGGTGLTMVEATGVVPEGRISIGCPSIEDDEHAAAFAPIIHFCTSTRREDGNPTVAHAGRKAACALPWADHKMATPEEGGWQAVSSSAIAFDGYPEPRALTVDEIHQLTKDFAAAAKRSIDSWL